MSNSEFICNICGYSFSKLSSLNSHRSKCIYCKRLKGTVILCNKCYNKFDNLYLFENHICNNVNLRLKDILNGTNDYIDQLNLLNQTYRKIIEDNLNIKVGDLNSINKKEEIKFKQKNEKKEEIKLEQKNDKKEEININMITSDNDINNLMNNQLKQLETVRNYNKIITNIKNTRIKYLTFNTIDSYKIIFDKNILNIQNILKKKFINDDKKIKKIIKKVISPLEMRIYMMKDFEKTNIEIDDIELLKNCITYYLKKDNLQVFNQSDFINNFMNYYLALFNIEDLIDIYTKNCKNLIYVNNNNSSPYSFYILDKIHGNKKYWKLDCRLDELISYFISNITAYCIKLYRTIYNNVYHDNDYRDNIFEYEVFEIDGNRLITTILLLSDQYKFSEILFKIIIKNCEYTPNNDDIFNVKTDDKLQKQQYEDMKNKDNNNIINQNLQLLFDNNHNNFLKDIINIKR